MKANSRTILMLLLLAANLSAAHAEYECSDIEVSNPQKGVAAAALAAAQNAEAASQQRLDAATATHKSAAQDLGAKRARLKVQQTFQDNLNMLLDGLRRWESAVETFNSDRQQIVNLDWNNSLAESLEQVKDSNLAPEFVSALTSVMDAFTALSPAGKAKVEDSFAAFKYSLTAQDVQAAKASAAIAGRILITVYNLNVPEVTKAEQDFKTAVSNESKAASDEGSAKDAHEAESKKVEPARTAYNNTPATVTKRKCWHFPDHRVY